MDQRRPFPDDAGQCEVSWRFHHCPPRAHLIFGMVMRSACVYPGPDILSSWAGAFSRNTERMFRRAGADPGRDDPKSLEAVKTTLKGG